MRIPFCVLLLVLLAGAAFSQSIMQTLSGISCASGEFRGVGVSQNENDAIALARSMIAGQIKSSVSYKSELKTEQRIQNGDERLNMKNTMQTEQKSNLLNAQDAHIKQSISKDGSFGVVACMSRANAAKPYAARQAQITDSLSMLGKAAPAEKSPKQKKAIWQKTSAFFNEYSENGRVLQSLGVVSAEIEKVVSIYELVKADYQNFCSNQEIYWKNAEDYGSKMLFSKFSGDFILNKSGGCENGLQISLEDSEIQCEYKASLGNYMCSFRPIFKGESCSGETFFQLQLSPAITVTGKSSRSAESMLEAKIRNGDFNQWKQELKKWVSICVE
jgi:hypothetical protein